MRVSSMRRRCPMRALRPGLSLANCAHRAHRIFQCPLHAPQIIRRIFFRIRETIILRTSRWCAEGVVLVSDECAKVAELGRCGHTGIATGNNLAHIIGDLVAIAPRHRRDVFQAAANIIGGAKPAARAPEPGRSRVQPYGAFPQNSRCDEMTPSRQ